MQIFYEFTVKTKGQGLYNFTKETTDWVKKQKIHNGILNLNILDILCVNFIIIKIKK